MNKTVTAERRCIVCQGTGLMEYPHPDDEGGFMAVGGLCPACVENGDCPACGQGMMVWGEVHICVHCGCSVDEAAAVAAQSAGRKVG